MNTISRYTAAALLTILTLTSCTNQEWEFPDYDYSTTYFPWQYPVRTIILGDVDYDNANDLQHAFVISAAMGGVYKNKEKQTVRFCLDETLCQGLTDKNTGRPLQALPHHYYTLSDDGTIIIPKGETSGGIKVQLSDAFFDDPLSLDVSYVLPLRILESTTDSVLRGNAAIDDADRRIETQWRVAPKDFTLFAVRYINPWHGRYLLRGSTTCRDAQGTAIDRCVYHQQYVERDIVTEMRTSSLTSVDWSTTIRVREGQTPGTLLMRITIADDGTCTLKSLPESTFAVTGSGSFVPDGDTWGGKSRDVFYLSYTAQAGSVTYEANDTLVFRNNGVKTEEFTPKVIQ